VDSCARRPADETETRDLKEDTSAESWDFQADDEIDASLVVIRPLGGGNRYEVFEAWDRRFSESVAAKVLRPNKVLEDRSRAALSREADIAKRLTHPNLIRFIRSSDAPPHPHLVFELVRASSVEDHLENVGPIRVPETCLLGIRMLLALQYMHDQQILHLDVKPANVTMGDPPRLLDLSLARPGTTIRLEREVGTPAYMAPEQCRRETLTPVTDLFGLGATLYEALTAMQPFSVGDVDGPDLETRYPQLVEEAVPLRELRPEIPRALEEVIMRCLAADPADRPQSAAESANKLTGVLDSLGLRDLLDR
jgi:serine/threonine protein kinase